LFKPFHQADSSISRRFGGTGLGLSLSKHLTEKLGGTIGVTSEPGQGTQFRLTLDTGSLDNTQFAHRIKQISYTNEADTNAATEKTLSGQILLAEDNPTNQQLISLFLRKMGADVAVAENGEIAVKMARQNHYDIIYMDMQMPKLSGIDAVKTLRNLDYIQPIVALTANATREDKIACIEAGCNDFLPKPISREKLYQMTSNFLRPAEKLTQSETPIVSTLLNEDPTFRDLVEKFVSELPDILDKLNHAYDKRDWSSLKAELHSLKGMGGGFGYQVLTELAAKAEFQIFSENYESAGTLLDEIGQKFELINEGLTLEENNANVVNLDAKIGGR
jgi:CheY-like chemotaxis protein